jgi:hypothetical protein
MNNTAPYYTMPSPQNTGGYGNMGDGIVEENLVCIGTFRKDIHIYPRLKAILETHGKDTAALTNAVLASLFSFNSDELELRSNAQVNQACTIYLRPVVLGLGAGKSHLMNIPMYCNVVRRQLSIGASFGSTGISIDRISMPLGMGQYSVDVNIGMNTFLTTALQHNASGAFQLNVWDLLFKDLFIQAGTPIYKGAH